MSNLKFLPQAWEEYLYWQSQDKKTLNKINKIIKDISRNPYTGIGKPEQLKGNLTGWWSRRIDNENQLFIEYPIHKILKLPNAKGITMID